MSVINLFINWNVENRTYVKLTLSKSVAYSTKIRLVCNFDVICYSPIRVGEHLPVFSNL